MKPIRFILCLLVILIANGCSAIDPTAAYQNLSAEQIYQGGERSLAKHEYKKAIEQFEALDSLYPFGANTEQAQIDLIYAYRENNDNASAVAAADRFIRTYPTSSRLDYVYYLKGLADYEQDRGWFQRFATTDLSQRDPGTMKQSFNDFSQLVQKFPNSRYAPDARQRMIHLNNMFASYELHVAEFYFQKEAYVAAANRANYIVQHYNGTPQVQEALVIMIKSYRALGLTEPANQALHVLQLNYPKNEALQELK